MILFIRRPQASWRALAAFGLLIGVGQFGLLYLAMRSDISPGLASLVIQTQVFFTIGLSIWLARQPVRPFQLVGLVLAAGGIAIIALHSDGSTTPRGLLLVLLGALCWALGNLVAVKAAQRAARIDMLAFVVWSSLFSTPPLFALSLWFEGWPAIVNGVTSATPGIWATVIWQTVGNTLFGYAVWNWLLTRHPAATITPMALLVPVFGMLASAIAIGEPLQAWKLGAATLVLSGLAINTLWPAFTALRLR